VTNGYRLSEAEFQAITQRLDALIQEFEALPFPDVREKVFELLQAIDAVHRAGLSQLVAFLRAHGQGALLDAAADDDTFVHALLVLYDLAPIDERTEVEAALESVRPYIQSHGGAIELLDVVDGVVHVRLLGACQGCAGAAITLKRGVEAALREGFRGFRGMAVHEPPTPTRGVGVIPLIQAGQTAPPDRRPDFQLAAHLADVPPGTMRAFDVGAVRVLLANVAGEIYAVRDACPGSMAPLDLGSFTPPIVVCPWHNEAYDIRTGKRADGEQGPGLAVLPIALVDGSIQVAVNTVEIGD